MASITGVACRQAIVSRHNLDILFEFWALPAHLCQRHELERCCRLMKYELHPDKTGLRPPGPTAFATELLVCLEEFRDAALHVWDVVKARLSDQLRMIGVKLRWQELATTAQIRFKGVLGLEFLIANTSDVNHWRMGSQSIPYGNIPSPDKRFAFNPEEARDWFRDLLRQGRPSNLDGFLRRVAVCYHNGQDSEDGKPTDDYSGLHVGVLLSTGGLGKELKDRISNSLQDIAMRGIVVDITFIICFDEFPAPWEAILKYAENPLRDRFCDFCK
eukprot:2407218-Heterocapsa_arctica.AAC.2